MSPRSARTSPSCARLVHGKPLVYLDSAASGTEAPGGDRRRARGLRTRLLERPPRRAHALHEGYRPLRRRAGQGPRLPRRQRREGDRVRPWHHRGHQPGGPELRPPARGSGRRGADLRPGAPLEHRALADVVRGEGRSPGGGARQRRRGDRAGGAGAAPLPPHQARGRGPRLERPRHRQPREGHRGDGHARGVPVLVDGAQGVPHLAVDVQALDCDFYCFSAHKLYGPSGVGRALRQAGAARGHASLAGRRRHDPVRELREDHLQQPALQVRGGYPQHRGGGGPGRGRRLGALGGAR